MNKYALELEPGIKCLLSKTMAEQQGLFVPPVNNQELNVSVQGSSFQLQLTQGCACVLCLY